MYFPLNPPSWLLLKETPSSCYDSTTGTLFFMDLSFFFSLILSNLFRLQTIRKISIRPHLSYTLLHFTNTCLPHGKPYAIKLNLILDSLSLYCAWLCYHTHAHHMFYASLSFCHYHVVISCPSYLDMPFSDSISRSNTNMYIQYDSI